MSFQIELSLDDLVKFFKEYKSSDYFRENKDKITMKEINNHILNSIVKKMEINKKNWDKLMLGLYSEDLSKKEMMEIVKGKRKKESKKEGKKEGKKEESNEKDKSEKGMTEIEKQIEKLRKEIAKYSGEKKKDDSKKGNRKSNNEKGKKKSSDKGESKKRESGEEEEEDKEEENKIGDKIYDRNDIKVYKYLKSIVVVGLKKKIDSELIEKIKNEFPNKFRWNQNLQTGPAWILMGGNKDKQIKTLLLILKSSEIESDE